MLYPHLATKRTVLRPIGADDCDGVYALLSKLGLQSLPPIRSFRMTFDRGSAAMFAVRLRAGGDDVGYATLHHRSPAGHVQTGVFVDTERARFGIGGEVSTLIVNYAFAQWPGLRKVYFLTTDASIEGFGVGLGKSTLEATLPEHLFFRGRHWDLYYYSIDRAGWEASGARFLQRLVPAGPRRTATQP